jgi:hypothetical protein
MLRIQRTANGDVVFTVSGRLEAHNVCELSALLADEQGGRTRVLDLKDLVLVDSDAVRFLRTCEADSIVLRNCPPYIRAWMAGDGEQPRFGGRQARKLPERPHGRIVRRANGHMSREENVMSTSTEMHAARQAIHDKIESQINTVQAKLETLKAKAESAKANAEIKLIADLLTNKRAIDQKLNELKKSGEGTYQQTKTDVESRLAELEKSVQAIEAKFKAA